MLVSRLHVVDALRGFAIVSIMLLHNLEHFDFYFLPPELPPWMVWLDGAIWNTLFFIFAGKSYAIFAFLFGLTFFIQNENQKLKGHPFHGRFAWRLVLLFLFGLINSTLYQGDILTIYAVVGFILIPANRLSDRSALVVAILLLAQPFQWWLLAKGVLNPITTLENPLSWAYFGRSGEFLAGGSFVETVVSNLTNGKLAVLNWSWENGRFFQIAALFILGMLSGRKQLFVSSEQNRVFWRKTLLTSALVFIPLFLSQRALGDWIPMESARRPLETMVASWSNFSFMLVLVASFYLLFNRPAGHQMLKIFSPLGRMSLSNYVMQSVMGTTIYYGFGLGLYQYTGSTYCLLIGVGLALLQGVFSWWWLKGHKQGPLEFLWHKATWLTLGK